MRTTELRFVEQLEKNSTAHPENIALIPAETGKSMTYGELWEYSGRVYRFLKQKNIGKEDVVMIAVPRDITPLIALIGIWRAGAAAIMLETDYAPERMAYIQQTLIFKPHPDDTVNYASFFPESRTIHGRFPAELMPILMESTFMFRKKIFLQWTGLPCGRRQGSTGHWQRMQDRRLHHEDSMFYSDQSKFRAYQREESPYSQRKTAVPISL
jgi:hypothetical protein